MKRLTDRIGKLAALGVIAVYLIPGFALADELVLCVAEDGRISFEEAHKGRCVSSHDASHEHGPGEEEETSLTSRRDCCGSCFDIPISSPTASAQQVPDGRDSSKNPVAQVSICDPVDSDLSSPPASRAESPGADPVARSALTILRSVVIVI